MPVLGLGTWQLTHNTAGTVARALKLGYRLIDTSGDYGTQAGIGEAIRRAKADRESFYLVTKVEDTDDAYEATRKNLAELGGEYADLMLIHRPPRTGTGKKLWEGLIRAKREGLTKDIGVSNYAIEQIEELEIATGERPVVNQIEWSSSLGTLPYVWPAVPESLREQLAAGGRLVIPVGGAKSVQQLLRIRHRGEADYAQETLGAVRFVPLIGEQGWENSKPRTLKPFHI